MTLKKGQGLLSRTLVDAPQSAGTYTVHWDGRDESGAMAASGSYFYQIDLSDQSRTQQMILMK